MEAKCIEFLKEISFEDYIPEFEKALFNDVESVKELANQSSILKEIINPIGHRAKFILKIKEHNQRIQTGNYSKKGTDFESGENRSVTTEVIQSKNNENSVTIEIDESITSAELVNLLEASDTSSATTHLATTEESSTEQAAAEVAITEPGSTQQIVENEIIKLLNLTAEGKILIKLYNTTGFDNKCRVKLAGYVVCTEYGADTNKVILPRRFKELAQQIEEAFPDENQSTYYVPAYTPRGGKTVIAKGKLYDKYTSLNKELRDSNLREKRPNQGSSIPLDLIPQDGTDDSIESYLRFLETCIQPWDSVVDYWKRTSIYRLNELLRDVQPHANVQSYFDKYGCLKQSQGYILLEIDFNIRFPDSKLRIFSHWELFVAKVKRELAKIGIHEFESDADLVQKFVQLFSVSPVKVPKGKAWRASRVEIVEGLMLHIKVIADFEKEITRIKALASKKGFSVQPFPLVVGENLKHINSSYVVIDGRPILVENPLRALEVAFKCYFALHCEYPIQSQRQWIVLQKTLFNVHVSNDRVDRVANHPEVKRYIKLLGC